MRKLLFLFLVTGIVAATLLVGLPANGQDFAVSIVGFRQSNYGYNREGLPLVYCGPYSNQPSGELNPHSFFVVIQNLQKAVDKMTMGASAWGDCLSFTITDSSGRTYSVSYMEPPASANPMVTWIFPSDGLRVVPVDFTGGDDWPFPGGWQGLPIPQREPEVVTMTVTFRFPDSNRKIASVTSRPTDVYLCSSSTP
jgi:hypothetical protein